MYKATKDELSIFYANVLFKSRKEKHKSRRYMADALGVSERSVRNWEYGLGAPSITDFTLWFETLGISMLQYLRKESRPEQEENQNSATMPEGLVSLDLHRAIADMDEHSKRELHFLIYGNHGGDFSAYMDKCVTDLQSNMHERHVTTMIAVANYEYHKVNNTLRCPDEVQPDLARLKQASEMGRVASHNGESSYAMPLHIEQGGKK